LAAGERQARYGAKIEGFVTAVTIPDDTLREGLRIDRGLSARLERQRWRRTMNPKETNVTPETMSTEQKSKDRELSGDELRDVSGGATPPGVPIPYPNVSSRDPLKK
jgi:hypothetical protein